MREETSGRALVMAPAQRAKVRDLLSLFKLDLGDVVCARDRDCEVFVGADVSLRGYRGDGSEQGCRCNSGCSPLDSGRQLTSCLPSSAFQRLT